MAGVLAAMAKTPRSLLEMLRAKQRQRKRLSKEERGIFDLLRSRKNQLRRVTKEERLAHPDIFSPKGAYYVKKSVPKITAKTPHVTVTLFKGAKQGVSHGTAAKQRLAGERGYKTAASEEQAGLQRRSAEARRNREHLKQHPEKIGPFPGWSRKRHSQNPYRPKTIDLDEYQRQRRRKLRGAWIEDGKWHSMIDIAQAIGDPMVQRLRQS
jgi:hypothetical protein